MKLETKVTKSSGFYDVDPLRGLIRKQLDEIVQSDAAFLKKVKMTFTDTKALKVGELRSLMAFGDPSKALPKLAGKTAKKTSPKKGSVGKEKAKKTSPKKSGSAGKAKKTSPKKGSKGSKGVTLAELKTLYKAKFGKAATGLKKDEIITLLASGSPKKSPKKPTSSGKGKSKKPVSAGKSINLSVSDMTVAQLKSLYKETFGKAAPTGSKKVELTKSLKTGLAVGTKAASAGKTKSAGKAKGKGSPKKSAGKTKKSPKKPVSKGKAKPKSEEPDYSAMKLAELMEAYEEKFGEEPGKRTKATLVRALNSGKKLAPQQSGDAKPTSGGKPSRTRPSSAPAGPPLGAKAPRCTDLDNFKKCGDDEYCGADGECLPGKGSGSYLQIPGRANVYGSIATLTELQKTLGGVIYDGSDQALASKPKTPKPKKSGTPKKPTTKKSETPKKSAEPAPIGKTGDQLSLSKRTEILAAIKEKLQECIAAESRAALV